MRADRITPATIIAALVFALTVLSVPAAAVAVGPGEVGAFPSWTAAGTSTHFSASATFPASAAFPTVGVTSTATAFGTAAGGGTFLGASTAFGQDFGSSRLQPYLSISTSTLLSNSVTTLTFGGAQPAGWGFALGDVDADWVQVQAYSDAAQTTPLPIADLGFQSVGNYCANAPKPSSCAGAGPFTDQPTWVTAPTLIRGVNYVPSTLVGSGSDTSGAYGWFTPASTIRSLTLTFGAQLGLPTYQLWLASPAPKTIISGTVAVAGAGTGAAVPAGTVAELNSTDGRPVLAIDDTPSRHTCNPTARSSSPWSSARATRSR